MKWRRILGLTAISGLIVMGCGSLAGLLPTLVTGGAEQVVQPVCIVQYDRLSPDADLGHDGCGNYWLRMFRVDSTLCLVISNDGQSMVPVVCPVEGDTLGGR